RVVLEVGVLHDHERRRRLGKPPPHGGTFAPIAIVPEDAEPGVLERVEDAWRSVRRTVVDDDQLLRERRLEGLFHDLSDRAFLVVAGHHHGETGRTGHGCHASGAVPPPLPRVSVCEPAYQAAPFIGATIESVLRQTDDRWELIVVDDASSDDTFSVASAYATDPRIRVTRNDQNLGPVGNWN